MVPPRSGTTLVAQYLINLFCCQYVTNLTSLFPRSPIAASRIFRGRKEFQPGDYNAFYGKSTGLSGANDGLYLWDKWIGYDRDNPNVDLTSEGAIQMRQFFGAMQQSDPLPIITKVNRAFICADQIAEALPSAMFVCLSRDPVLMAQSLYLAREAILGDMSQPYGVNHPNRDRADPVEDVCRQTEFYIEQTARLTECLGPDRLCVLQYEDFCRDPAGVTNWARNEADLEYRVESSASASDSFRVSNARRVDEKIYRVFEERLRND